MFGYAVDKMDTWLVVFVVCNPPFVRSHADRPTIASIVLDTAFIHSVDRSFRGQISVAQSSD